MTSPDLTEAMLTALGYQPCPDADGWARVFELNIAAGTHLEDVDLCSEDDAA